MKDHSQFAEDLPLYALGALDARDCPEMQAHLNGCEECRRELDSLRGDMALVALSAAGPQPPQRSRQRLMNALGKSPAAAKMAPVIQLGSRRRPAWLFWAPLAACILLAASTAMLWRANREARRDYAEALKDLNLERARSAHAQEIIDMINDPKAMHMTLQLVDTKSAPQPQVKTIYVPDKGHALVIANNLPEPPEHMAYELWLLPSQGKPMPCGTFKTDWRGHGMKLLAASHGHLNAKGFAVTMEPEAGSPWPTGDVILQPTQ